MKCQQCNTINANDAKYCRNCGAELQKEEGFLSKTISLIRENRILKPDSTIFWILIMLLIYIIVGMI